MTFGSIWRQCAISSLNSEFLLQDCHELSFPNARADESLPLVKIVQIHGVVAGAMRATQAYMSSNLSFQY